MNTKITNKEFRNLTQKLQQSKDKSGTELRKVIYNFIKEKTNKDGIWEEKRKDLKYPNLFIEIKSYNYFKNTKKMQEIFKKQIEKYMKKSLLKYGVLFDGTHIYFYKREIINDNQIEIKEIGQEYSGELTKDGIEFLLNLLSEEEYDMVPESLSIAFGHLTTNNFMKPILRNFWKAFKENTSTKKTKVYMLFEEWDKLFKISEERRYSKEEVKRRREILSKIFETEIIDEKDEMEALFILHTVLSIIIKILVYQILLHENKIAKVFGKSDIYNASSDNIKKWMKAIEYGKPFLESGILNLITYDYFSWYVSIKWEQYFYKTIQKLLDQISSYKPLNIKITTDYVKNLYLSYIPKEIRHSFGEFFTPDEIAYFVVDKVANIQPNDKVIDPTCGSGTFLVETIKKKLIHNKSYEEILKTIYGIDLNPINVLLTKLNIVANTIRYITENHDFVIIPVFIGDMSYIPNKETINNINIIRYKWPLMNNFPEIIFPIDFVKDKKFFNHMYEIIEKIEKCPVREKLCKIEKCKRDISEELIKKITLTINQRLPQNVETMIEQWIEKIIEYHCKNLNLIWLHLFINYIYPFSITPYDKVVGNPPWVRWSALPTNYREELKKTLKVKGLFSSDKNIGGIDLNIYALITYNSLEYLLKDNGILSFLLPRNSLQNKSLEGFRQLCFIEKGKLLSPIYLADKKFFKEISTPFVILSIQKK